MKVLLVDDNDLVLRSLGRALGMHCDVVVADTVDRALIELDEPFDAVVCDFDLREARDGVWLLREVAQRHPGARRVLLTGSGRAAQEADSIVTLEKPVGTRDVLDVLGIEPREL